MGINARRRANKKSLDLTKTQVLNFSEVEEVAKYEKKTSKKPAIVLASIGVFAIMLGLFYPTINSSLKKDNNNSSTVLESNLRDTKEVSNFANSLTCSYTKTTTEDNTTSVTTFNFKFDNAKLSSYEKVLNIVSTAPVTTVTPVSMVNVDSVINTVILNPISGYTITRNYQADQTNSNVVVNYTVRADVDLNKLNKNDLTMEYSSNDFLNVPYSLKDNYDVVKQNLEILGYICN